MVPWDDSCFRLVLLGYRFMAINNRALPSIWIFTSNHCTTANLVVGDQFVNTEVSV